MRQASLANGLAAAGALFFFFCGCAGSETGQPDPARSGGSGGGGPAGGSGGLATGGATASGGAGQAGSGSTGGAVGTGGQGTAGTGGAAGTVGTGGRGATGGAGTGGRAGTGGAGAGGGGGSGAATGGAGGRGGTTGTGGRGGTAGTAGRGPHTLDFVGNITTSNAVDTDGKVFSRHWNQISPENAGKWGAVQPSAGAAFNWRTLDAVYDYAQQNNLIFKEHTFIWGTQQPSGSIGESNVKSWMTEFCKRYPNTKLIDVVNEPPPHTTPSYANAIGGGTNGTWQWITNAFKWAREACPNATLILNDYNNIEWSTDQAHFLGIVKTIKEAGAPIDAIGAQAHDLDYGGQVTLATVQTFLTRLYTEGQLPIYVTEMDISSTDDNQQLQLYQQFFPLFRDSGYVKGVTIWGWIYGKTWSKAPNSGLVRNGSPRPAMTWLMQQLGRPTP